LLNQEYRTTPILVVWSDIRNRLATALVQFFTVLNSSLSIEPEASRRKIKSKNRKVHSVTKNNIVFITNSTTRQTQENCTNDTK